MSSILSSVCSALSLPTLSSAPAHDYLQTETGHLYCLHLRMGRVLELQRQFGTGKVSYCPHPLLAVTAKPCPRKASTLLVVVGQGANVDSLTRLLPHLRGCFKTVSQVEESQLQPPIAVNLFHSVGFVILYQLADPLLCWLVVASGCPFFVVGEIPAELPRLLSTVGVDCNWSLVASDYYQLKANLRQTLDLGLEPFQAGLGPQINKARLLLKWVPRAMSFRDLHFDSSLAGDLSVKAPLKLCLSPTDYPWSGLKHTATELARFNTPGGIHLELACLYTFVTTESLYLHPWLGVVETTKMEHLEELLSRPHFTHSCLACVGLLVLNEEVQLQLRSRLDLLGLPVPVRIAAPPVEIKGGFEVEQWERAGCLVALSGPGSEPDPLRASSELSLPIFKSPQLYGPFYQALVELRPPVCPPSALARALLGADYPLLTLGLEPFQLRSFVTVARVQAAQEHLGRVLVSPAAWLKGLAGSRVGSIIKRIGRENIDD